MNNVLKDFMSQLGDRELEAMSREAGIDKSQAANGLEAIMPTLLGAMASNTQSREGASSFLSALDRDHDGSILDDVAGFIMSPDKGQGSGILSHVLGDNRHEVEAKISRKSGISMTAVSKLLEIAAPLVMGYLARQKKSQSGFETGNVGSLLTQLAGKANKESSFDLSDVIGMVASSTGRGQKNDLGDVAGSILGKLF